ncbi:MAG: DUF3336 domain-containing protein, partial [Woeseiaceae bacterium]|nr:DUF3336 domain-containing protein [Woeseiaceae bacterium]
MVIDFSKGLEKDLAAAESYADWVSTAIKFDKKNRNDLWKATAETGLYDYVSIGDRLKTLRELRGKRDAHGLLFALNEGIHGNLGGMGSAALYERAKFGTKQLIEDYIEEVVSALEFLGNRRVKKITVAEKTQFLDRAAHCFGRSALVLSGAGALLYFHLGVVKALWEQGILPRVISGSSGGSLVAALVGTRSDNELTSIFDPEYLAMEVEREVGLMKLLSISSRKRIPIEDVVAVINRLIPDLTFQEAQEKTGIHINISVAPADVHQKSRMLNATTSPNVMVREAVLASCAVPGVYPPVTLVAKNVDGKKQPYLPSRRWIDGSIVEDVPLKRLARLYGVNHSIVSQTNPVVLPFVNENKEKQSLWDILQHAGLKTAKEWTLAAGQIARKPLNEQSSFNRLVSSYMS